MKEDESWRDKYSEKCKYFDGDYFPCPGSVTINHAVFMSRPDDKPDPDLDIYPVNYP